MNRFLLISFIAVESAFVIWLIYVIIWGIVEERKDMKRIDREFSDFTNRRNKDLCKHFGTCVYACTYQGHCPADKKLCRGDCTGCALYQIFEGPKKGGDE